MPLFYIWTDVLFNFDEWRELEEWRKKTNCHTTHNRILKLDENDTIFTNKVVASGKWSNKFNKLSPFCMKFPLFLDQFLSLSISLLSWLICEILTKATTKKIVFLFKTVLIGDNWNIFTYIYFNMVCILCWRHSCGLSSEITLCRALCQSSFQIFRELHLPCRDDSMFEFRWKAWIICSICLQREREKVHYWFGPFFIKFNNIANKNVLVFSISNFRNERKKAIQEHSKFPQFQQN